MALGQQVRQSAEELHPQKEGAGRPHLPDLPNQVKTQVFQAGQGGDALLGALLQGVPLRLGLPPLPGRLPLKEGRLAVLEDLFPRLLHGRTLPMPSGRPLRTGTMASMNP